MGIIEAVKVSGDLAKIIRHIMRLKSFSGSDNHIGESGKVDDEPQCLWLSQGVNVRQSGHGAFVA
jgi:hypothetical protein